MFKQSSNFRTSIGHSITKKAVYETGPRSLPFHGAASDDRPSIRKQNSKLSQLDISFQMEFGGDDGDSNPLITPKSKIICHETGLSCFTKHNATFDASFVIEFSGEDEESDGMISLLSPISGTGTTLTGSNTFKAWGMDDSSSISLGLGDLHVDDDAPTITTLSDKTFKGPSTSTLDKPFEAELKQRPSSCIETRQDEDKPCFDENATGLHACFKYEFREDDDMISLDSIFSG